MMMKLNKNQKALAAAGLTFLLLVGILITVRYTVDPKELHENNDPNNKLDLKTLSGITAGILFLSGVAGWGAKTIMTRYSY